MISSHTLRLVTLASLGSLIGASALAQEDRYFYGGLSGGQSRAKFDEHRISDTLLGTGLVATDISHDDRDKAYKVFGGYQFNRYFALEGGYFNLGRFNFTTTTVPAGTLSGEMKLHGFNLDAVGTLPMTERWSALGRIGAQYAKANDSFNGTGAVVVADHSPSKSKTNYKMGLGLQFAMTPSVLLRGEVERFRINDAMGNTDNVHMVSVGLVFPFGRASAPVRHAQAEPAPMAPPPEPAVVPVAEPAPIVAPVVTALPRRRVSFSAESLYGFDKSALQPEGKTALDTFAKELEGTRFDTVSVEGHTDRLGTPAYNQKLSQQRAEAVKDYLVSSGKLDSTKVTATGKGESTPVTKPEDCKGNKPNAKLIACLQPDRRVDIEVVGTR
jgi:OOP family OmpA-OmpF porin